MMAKPPDIPGNLPPSERQVRDSTAPASTEAIPAAIAEATPVEIAEAVRQACLDAALEQYEAAGMSGLCHEGRWECAVDAIRSLDLRQWASPPQVQPVNDDIDDPAADQRPRGS